MIRLAILFLLSASLSFACGDDGVGLEGDLVGGPCSGAADCDERCQTGGDYPGGICTVACDTDDDCPLGTRCIDKEGGICLLACEHPDDCRAGYTCQGEENRGHGGDSLVCVDD